MFNGLPLKSSTVPQPFTFKIFRVGITLKKQIKKTIHKIALLFIFLAFPQIPPVELYFLLLSIARHPLKYNYRLNQIFLKIHAH